MRQGPVAQSPEQEPRPGTRGGDEASDSAVAQQYGALTKGVALVDRSDVGRLRLTGDDALDLLQRLSTNDLEPLQPGTGAATVLTSNKGRIVDLLVVLSLEEDTLTPALSRSRERGKKELLVLTAAHNRAKVAEWIDFYTFAEDIHVEDVTEETAAISVVGPGAASTVARVTGDNPASMDRFSSVQTAVFGVGALMVRTDFAGVPAFDLIVATSEAPRLRERLLEQGEEDGITEAGAEAVEAVRIGHEVPVSGRELTEDFNPLEAGLMEFISFTKGCYVGQEVVTRLNTYQKVSKRLVGLRWGLDASVSQGARLFDDGKQVGAVTSAAALHLTGGVGLGYVRKAQSEDGTVLSVETDGGEAPVEVVSAGS